MTLNVFTIASDAPFLDVLVEQITAGFPVAQSGALPPLSQWTILMPNRRTARELRERFLALSKHDAVILPRIDAIGDLDEDLLADIAGPAEIGDALSPVARQFILQGLVSEWAAANPHIGLAATLSRSPQQVQALATSLAQLVDELEIEERPLSLIREVMGLDLAHHREAILGLVGLIDVRLPQVTHAEGLIGRMERRSRLIRANAASLASAQPARPIVAAGSTGSVPATRFLLKTIAALPNGAVVLPGFDTALTPAEWEAVSPQHSQYAMKVMVGEMGLEPRHVQTLGPEPGARTRLASEIMRPSETTDLWSKLLPEASAQFGSAMRGVHLLRCRDTVEEAATLAAFVRSAIEAKSGSIGIITPNRILARRIKVALGRFGIFPADTSGEALIFHGAARSMALLLDLAEDVSSSVALASLLLDPQSRFGLPREQFSTLAADIDITLLRSAFMRRGLAQIPQLLQQVEAGAQHGIRPHADAVKPGTAAWATFATQVLGVHDQLQPLVAAGAAPLSQHLDLLLSLARCIFDSTQWQGQAALEILGLIEELQAESHRLPPMPLSEAAATLRRSLAMAKHYPVEPVTPNVSLVGLLEARLLRFDTIIVAGLSEASWPGPTDTGPWLNRPMRSVLEVQQPESAIGQMAHDFVQLLGGPTVVLSWSDKEGSEQQLPSRWMLRLRTILSAAAVDADTTTMEGWRQVARRLEQADAVVPAALPIAKPKPHQRPRRISVTQVKTLLDDPYAVYARDVLKLSPLDAIGSSRVSATVRGQLFHLALGNFFKAHPLAPSHDALGLLLAEGRSAFSLFDPGPEITHYWWPRFERVAQWLAGELELFYGDGGRVVAETNGHGEMVLADMLMAVTGRADLISLRANGTAQIFDFKTGSVPTLSEGQTFTYQLTIEAALLAQGAFEGLPAAPTAAASYVKVAGRIPAGEVKNIAAKTLAKADQHWNKLQLLLDGYRSPEQPYFPRANVVKESETRDYDHLSRFREWIVRGVGP